jgi:uncharacterized protein (DUF362 family)
MMDNDRADRGVDRRELLLRWAPPTLAAALLAATGGWLHGRPGRHRPPDDAAAAGPLDWRRHTDLPGAIAVASGAGPAENVGRALEALGGMSHFVPAGARVAIKPNVAWDRTPEQAANTDPTVVATLVRLCLAAGAASVVVVDNTCNDPSRTFARSGIAEAAREAGARVLHQGTAGTTVRDLGGTLLGTWEVLQPLVEADCVLNVPVVKHHSLARATIGMKNWIGAVVGRRANLHQRIHQTCAELAAALRPTLTVVDATRVLTGGGPTGGSLALVKAADSVAVSTDPVAADAWGGTFLGLEPRDLPALEVAERLGLGTADWRSVARG